MVSRALRATLVLAAGGLLALGVLVGRHLTAGDVHALLDHVRRGQPAELTEHVASRAEAAAEAQKRAMLARAEQAADELVDRAADRLKAEVDQAADEAAGRVKSELDRAADDAKAKVKDRLRPRTGGDAQVEETDSPQ